eukprot:jgi/Ulvmu1/1893/UM012_0050.1
MHFLNTELEEYREEMSSLRVQLSSKSSQLEEVTGERDRCRKALEEAHSCVSDYHKKLSTMERTVGHALVSRGELKEAQSKLEEAKELNMQYKETLAAADLRVESMEDTIAEQRGRIQALESSVEHEKEEASSASYDRIRLTKRTEELENELDEVRARLGSAEGQRDTSRQEAEEVGKQHAETLAALSDLITIQKRSDTERGTLEITLREQQAAISRHKGTIEGLKEQLDAARHARLRAVADEACKGVAFGSAAHRGAARAAGRAVDALAEALPGLHAALREASHEEPAGRGDDCRGSDRCGSPAEPARPQGDACSMRPGEGQHGHGSSGVTQSVDALHQITQMLARSSMFYEADDAQQSLYTALRDMWAAMEARLAEALPEVAAVMGRGREAAREAQHRQAHLRDALRDTHDALARATAERHRAKQLASDLHEQLDAEQHRGADEVAAAQAAARGDAMRREEELRAARAGVAELESALLHERSEAQRLRAEHDHQMHAAQVEMRARFATLRDSYQRQLDSLHMQVADIEATSRRPCLPRLADAAGAGAAVPEAARGHCANGRDASPDNRLCWGSASRGAAAANETPRRAEENERMYAGWGGTAEQSGHRGDNTEEWGTGAHVRSWEGAGGSGAESSPSWQLSAGFLPQWSAAASAEQTGRPRRRLGRSYSPSPRQARQHVNPILDGTPDPSCDTPTWDHAARRDGAQPSHGRGTSEPPRREPAGAALQQGGSAAQHAAWAHSPRDGQSMPAAGVWAEWHGSIKVPTQPGSAPTARSGDTFAMCMEDLPADPRFTTSHLDGVRAATDIAERQARAHGSLAGNTFDWSYDTPAHAREPDPGPSMPASRAAAGKPQSDAAVPPPPAAAAAGSRPACEEGAAWGHAALGQWHGGGAAQQPQRPQSEYAHACARHAIDETGLASPEAIFLASQHEGNEGHARPRSARPSDHWPDHGARPAAAAPGQLRPQARPLSAARRAVPSSPRASTGATARRVGKTAPAAAPPLGAPSHTESAVLAALKKSGLLDRLGDSAALDKPPSSMKRKKTVKGSKVVRGRSRTPKQASLWQL